MSDGAVGVILDSLYTRLAASTLSTALGGRIALDRAAADTALPLMVYSVESMRISKVFGSGSVYELNLIFYFYKAHTDATSIHTYVDLLTTALASQILPTGFDRVTLIRTSPSAPSFDDDGWTMTDRYRATGYKSS